MKREYLKELGLSDEQIDKIMGENGKDVEAQKAKTTAAETEREGLKTQLAEAGKQIEAFKGMNIDQIKASADEWKTKAEKAQADAAAQVAQLKFDHALESALTGAKVKDVVSVKAHLKTDALKLQEDGSIMGLKEQLDTLKTSKDFLFESETPTPKIVTGGNNQTVITDPFLAAMRKGANLPTEQGK